MVNKLYKLYKIFREYIFPIDNVAQVRSRKTFYHISANFQNPGFHLVSKPRKLVFIFRTGPTTTTLHDKNGEQVCIIINLLVT